MDRVVHTVDAAMDMLAELEAKKLSRFARKQSLERRRGLLAIQYTRALKEIETYLFESYKDIKHEVLLLRMDSRSTKTASVLERDALKKSVL